MEARLQLIQEMIEKTKRSAAESGTFLILWGWLVFIGCLLQYGLIFMNLSRYSFIMWGALVLMGAIYSIRETRKLERSSGVQTYSGAMLTSLWQACGVGIILIVFVGTPFGMLPISAMIPVIATIAGIGTFVSGRVIEETWLVVGGIAWWAGAMLMMFLPFNLHILVMALIIIPGYLAPGYKLKDNAVSPV